MADLERFVQAQDQGGTYDRALAELRAGRKTSHWMWFVFPQIAGLGRSATAQRYAIQSVGGGARLPRPPGPGAAAARVRGGAPDQSGSSAEQILGGIDAMKLRSSMTLFALAAPGEAVFDEVLERYFGGERDEATERLA